MARAMWRGAIQFGLVTIPVKLYLATEARRGLSLQPPPRAGPAAHPDEGALPDAWRDLPLRHRPWLRVRARPIRGHRGRGPRGGPAQDRALHRDRAVRRGRPGRARLDLRPKQAYYLEPEAIGRKAFQLLRAVLAETGLQAICKMVLKDREHLAALDPFGPTLCSPPSSGPTRSGTWASWTCPTRRSRSGRPSWPWLASSWRRHGRVRPCPVSRRVPRGPDLHHRGQGGGRTGPRGRSGRTTGGQDADLMAILEASVAAARAESSTHRADTTEQGPVTGRRGTSAAARRTTRGAKDGPDRSASDKASGDAAPARRRKTA